MKMALACVLAISAIAAGLARPAAQAGGTSLATPGFHHLHLNSVNPEAAVDFYTKAFLSTSKTTFARQPALQSPNDVLVLFNKVNTPPATDPQTAFWHFGWHVTDVHQSLEMFKQRGITLLPLYTEEGGGTVFTSGDTWPGTGGVLGLTKAGIADAKAKGVTPAGGAGFAYLRGPDDAIVEYQGNMPAERFNHIHMFHEQPFCAQRWYQTHLNLSAAGRDNPPSHTDADCRVQRGPDRTWPALTHDGAYRTPSNNAMAFSGVSLLSYMNPSDQPLVSTRGHLMDHYGLSVANLDGWIAKLRGEKVTFLEQPYQVGEHRAVMIEGPSREAIELIEIK